MGTNKGYISINTAGLFINFSADSYSTQAPINPSLDITGYNLFLFSLPIKCCRSAFKFKSTYIVLKYGKNRTQTNLSGMMEGLDTCTGWFSAGFKELITSYPIKFTSRFSRSALSKLILH